MLVSNPEVDFPYSLLPRRSSGELYVAGAQDIDQSWMTAVRSNCVARCPKIVPRFVWEAERLTWEVTVGWFTLH